VSVKAIQTAPTLMHHPAGSAGSVAEALLATTESHSSRDELGRLGSSMEELDGSSAGELRWTSVVRVYCVG
jgi:hypothetical protein